MNKLLLPVFLALLLCSGCENKKQFKKDTIEILGLVDKALNSPKFLAYSVISEAETKYKLLKVNYPKLLTEYYTIELQFNLVFINLESIDIVFDEELHEKAKAAIENELDLI